MDDQKENNALGQMQQRIDAMRAQLAHQELANAAELPAFFVNRIVVDALPEHIRIAFLERQNENSSSVPRCAVILAVPDAEAFIDVLKVALARLQEHKKDAGTGHIVMDFPSGMN